MTWVDSVGPGMGESEKSDRIWRLERVEDVNTSANARNRCRVKMLWTISIDPTKRDPEGFFPIGTEDDLSGVGIRP